MSNQSPEYSKFFKDQLILRALDPSASTTQVALDGGIAPNVLRNWLDEYYETRYADSGLSAAEYMERIHELESQVKKLEDDNKFLRRAVAYFAVETLPEESS